MTRTAHPNLTVVTGAAHGIGRAVASRLAAAGAAVLAVDLDKEVHTLRGTRVLTAIADAMNPEALNAAIAEAQSKFGPLDAAVLNVAVARYGPLHLSTPEEISATTSGTFHVARHGLDVVLGAMSGAGSVVMITSGSGKGSARRGAYGISKAGIDGTVRALAPRLGARGVRVNAVSPGPIMTRANSHVWGDDQLREIGALRIPLLRWGTPEEVAGPIVFLLSPDSAALNGGILPVDGGVSASNPVFDPLPRDPHRAQTTSTEEVTVLGHATALGTSIARHLQEAGRTVCSPTESTTGRSSAIVLLAPHRGDDTARHDMWQDTIDEALAAFRIAASQSGAGGAVTFITELRDSPEDIVLESSLETLMRCAAVEYGAHGLRVNLIHAGQGSIHELAATLTEFTLGPDASYLHGAVLRVRQPHAH